MASVVEQQKDPAAKFGTLVDEQIAQTTGRIRIHDISLGALLVAALVAIYATGMIVLDKNLNLAEWVRQLALLGFLGVLGVVAYLFVVRPLRQQINPLYAAARVEKTIDDAKNSVTGYVEAQEKGDVHAAVKAAMSARAARSLDDADVNRAVDHRSLLVAGGVLVAFLLVLVVLFFVFRPSQFTSLIGRAFVPFSSDPIATRTQLTLIKPTPPGPTITTGQTITVAVHVGGKVPATDSPSRVRVLLRHNPADPNYEELPMDQGETTRDWQVKVPEYLVQNGFWYKVAAGDAETPEYRVSVRSLPQFTDFEATFEYPAYTHKPNDRAADAHIRAYRGTQVTLVAKTNREVKEGVLKFDAPGLAPVTGTPVAGKPDSLQFQFTVTEPAKYQLWMTTVTGEKNTDSPFYTISLDTDTAPTVQITKPAQVETETPANGQLAVDGTVGDDFGIDKVRLRMRVDGRDLAPVFYMGGQSLRRQKDNTWPRDLRPDGFKLSADLTKLLYADGAKFEPRDKMVIEFWVEAIDNCTEAPAVEGWGEKPQRGNVGRSEVYKLNLTPPRTDEADKQALDQKKEQRQNEEKQHNQQQQQKFDNEKRDTKPQPQQPDKKDGTDNPPPPKPGDKKDGTEGKQDPNQKGAGGKDGNPPKKDDTTPPKKDGKTEPMMGGGMGGMPEQKSDPKPDPQMGGMNNPGMGGMSDPKMPPDMSPKKDDMQQPMGGGMNNPGKGSDPNQAPMPKTPEEKKNEEQARQDRERVQQELDKNKAEGGDAKPNPATKPEDRTEPANPKPQPKMGAGEQPDSQPKEGPKPSDPANPMQKGGDGASESKPAGNLEQPTDPAAPKPTPKEPDPKDPKKPAQPSETRNEPLGGAPGTEKPEPKKDETQPKGDPKTDPMSGSAGKPATDQKDGDPGTKPKDPPADAGTTKPNPEPARGADKDPTQQKAGGPPPETKPKDDPMAGGAKPQQQPPSAEQKPPMAPKDPMGKQPDASEPKPEPKGDTNPMGGGAAEPRPEPTPPKGGNKDINPGEDKPQPKDAPPGGDPKEKGKEPKNGNGSKDTQPKELTEQQKKELQDAARDLNNPDPAKRKEAQDKLDKTIGEEKRKEIEKLQKDLDSPDKGTRDAAQQKLQDMMKKGDDGKQGDDTGKKLSPEDVAKLQDQLKDLNSKDENKRKEAEKNFDDKLGKDAREKLQEQMKNPSPMNDPKAEEEAKKKLEEMLKDQQGRGKGPIDPKQPHKGPGSSTDPARDAMADDPRNRAKTAQLQLEEFEKHRYDNDLKEKLGWSDEKWQKFLDDEAERVRQLQKEADAYEQALRNQPPVPTGSPTITTGTGGKVDERPGVPGVGGTSSGATAAPPGFDEARRRFLEEAAKLKKKQ